MESKLQKEVIDFPLHMLNIEDRRDFEKFGTGPKIAPDHTLIHCAIAEAVDKYPGNLALQCGEKYLNYQDLDEQSNTLALSLTELGVSNGCPVGLFIKRSIDMVIAIVAILKIGACYVPQDASSTPKEQLKHVVEDGDLSVILTSKEFENELQGYFSNKVKVIAELVKREPDNEKLEKFYPWSGSADQRAFILYTSGTTGRPNGVQVTHRNLCNILLTNPGCLGMRPGARVAQLLNIGFDMAAWEVLGCLSHGATLMLRGDDINATAKRCNILIATPSILASIELETCHHIESVAVAGEPCPVQLAEKWALRCKFYNCCGPTETTIINTASLFKTGEQLTIGRPTPNNTVYILDKTGTPCAIGETGEMWAGGDCVTAGYLNNASLNAARYMPDPYLGGDNKMFNTRDLGRWTPSGELIHLGRVDDQVKVRGFRVELDGVTANLERSSGCSRAVTLKLDNRNLIAFVQPKGADVLDARNKVESAMPYYCVPKAIFSLARLPLTSRGKIDKRKLLAYAKHQLSVDQKEREETC